MNFMLHKVVFHAKHNKIFPSSNTNGLNRLQPHRLYFIAM